MSQAFLTLAFWDWPTHAVHKLLLLIDSGIYWLASQAYQLFVKLSQTRIFEDQFFSNFANRIYAILGVFMLFYLAYALLMALIDPEKFTKGDKGVGKIASNLVISLVILGFLPSIFTYAYRLQNYILSSNLMGSLILGTPLLEVGESDDNNEAMLKYGDVLSFTVLNTFLNPDNVNFNMGKTSSNQDYNWFDFKYDVLKNSNYLNMSAMSTAVSTGVNPLNGSTSENIVIDYKFPISTIGGVILCFLLITFTLDLGVRVIKFAFYQLIAPIPVIMRIIPGKKGTFDKWLKQTLFVYAEVFIRVAIMYMVIYFINGIANSASMEQFFGEGSGLQGKLAFVVIIMGMLAFAKQAPKMISDMLGIDTGGLKLGIGEKLKAGGFFAGGAVLGAGITGLVNNTTHGLGSMGKNIWAHGKQAFTNFKAGKFAEGFKEIGSGGASLVGGLAMTPMSMLAGTTSGAFNAYKSGKGAKNLGEMKKAASTGAQTSITNREKRKKYHATHSTIPLFGDAVSHIPIVGGVMNAVGGTVAGHVGDVVSSAGQWAGVTPSMESLRNSQSAITAVTDAQKAFTDRAKFIRDTLEGRNRTLKSVKWKDSNGHEVVSRDVHLGILSERINRIQQTGEDENGNKVDAVTRFNLAQLLKAADKQAVHDIAKGLDKDGVSYVKPENYDGGLQAEAIKLITAVNNASRTMQENVKNHTSKLDIATSFANENQNANIAKLATSGVDIYDQLVDSITKPMYEAKDNVNQKINAVYEQQEKKK